MSSITRKFGSALLLPVACAAAFAAAAEDRAPAAASLPAADAPAIRWRTGAAAVANPGLAARAQALAAAAAADERHIVVQFNQPLTPDVRADFEAAGATLQAYLGGNAFFAHLDPAAPGADALARHAALVDVRRIELPWKLHPMFARRETPQWAVVPPPADANAPDEPWVAVYVMFHADTPMDDAAAIAAAGGALIASQLFTVNGLVLEMPLANVETLAAHDAVMFLEPALPPMIENNNSNRAITQADIVQAAPYGLTGAGVNVLVYDGGYAYAPHVDFQGRLTVRDTSGLSTHATHVSGTIGGAGVANALYKGMAPGVTIQSYGFEQVGGLHQGFLYIDPGDLQNDYNQAINTYGADIANNSIGTNTASNGFPCDWEGDYGVTSALIDSIVVGSLGSPFRIVWANGNERGSGRCGTTYHTTAPPACAKNHITVGALNSNDDSVTYFTSWGPTDDGRLKPDISAPGCQVGTDNGVTSCSATATGYITYCGTSMASPTVCGLSSLLLQDYRALHPAQPDPRNSTLKALLAHNAQDIDAAGPDYKTGYGSVRIQRTIDFLRSGQFVEEQLSQGGVYSVMIAVSAGAPELKVTLAWDDVPSAPNVVGTIVNDLDIVVLDPAGTQHFPWTLGGLANPSAPAVKTQADHVNNIEQVHVAAPAAGVWTVEIRGFNVPTGPQSFSVCFTPGATADCNGNGVNDLTDIANGTSQDCNANSVPDECESQADCNANGTFDFCDIYSHASNDVNGNAVPDECEPDCNANGVPDSWDISSGASQDCNANQSPDECDIAGGSSTDCDGNGVPDECGTDCNNNGVADACDIAGGTSDDCDGNGVPDECQSTADCNTNGVADFCDIGSGTSNDVNANAVPDECEPDCNHNGIPDAWDLSTGASQDCNGNSQPDECDIAGGVSTDCDLNGVPDECQPDCNGNGLPDLCDIQSGYSIDCNANGVPDECENDCNLNGVADECDIANGTSQDLNGDGFPDECDKLYVNQYAVGGNNGTSWNDAYVSLDDAIAQAGVNLGVAQIWVAWGDYAPYATGTFTIRSGLTLYGGFYGYETSLAERDPFSYSILDGYLGGPYAEHVVTLANLTGTVLDGFEITAGYAGSLTGGGVLVQGGSPTLKNCIVWGNYADSGAGVSVFSASPAFLDCMFYYNDAQDGDGGAIRTSGPGALTLTGCYFYYNSAAENGTGLGRGGAVHNAAGSALSVTSCYFESNYAWNGLLVNATKGGALANFSTNASVARTIFWTNQANTGGGLYTSAPITVVNCDFSGNIADEPFDNGAPANAGWGGALFGEAGVNVTLKSSTLAANWSFKKGAGVAMDGVCHNSILWYNVVDPAQGLSTVEQQYRGSIAFRYSDVAGLIDGIPGEDPPDPADIPGCVQTDPLFVLAPDITGGLFTAGDLHLETGSPCIDSGENASVPAGTTTDLDGVPRLRDDCLAPNTGSGSPPVDMGAYERAGAPYVLQQPLSVSASEGGFAEFYVYALGSGTLTYQWRKDGVNLVDGGSVYGATTEYLYIEPLALTDAGSYDVVVTGACGAATSTAATLTVAAVCVPCDANCDGSINPFDIQPFVDALGGGATCSPCAGDANGDGTTNPFDINAFLTCLGG